MPKWLGDDNVFSFPSRRERRKAGQEMSGGVVRLYRRDWSPEQVLRRVDSLAASGMVLAYPGTGRITAIIGEWENAGEQIEMNRDELLAAMTDLGEKSFSFQYWIADKEDDSLICTLSRVGIDVVVEDYGLDGFGGAGLADRAGHDHPPAAR